MVRIQTQLNSHLEWEVPPALCNSTRRNLEVWSRRERGPAGHWSISNKFLSSWKSTFGCWVEIIKVSNNKNWRQRSLLQNYWRNDLILILTTGKDIGPNGGPWLYFRPNWRWHLWKSKRPSMADCGNTLDFKTLESQFYGSSIVVFNSTWPHLVILKPGVYKELARLHALNAEIEL